jgi:hypothetical protein
MDKTPNPDPRNLQDHGEGAARSKVEEVFATAFWQWYE